MNKTSKFCLHYRRIHPDTISKLTHSHKDTKVASFLSQDASSCDGRSQNQTNNTALTTSLI